MSVARGRVLRAGGGLTVTPLHAECGARSRGPAVLKGAVADASIEAARRVDAAERRAQEIVRAAQEEAARLRIQACDEGRAQAEAEWAAAWLRLRAEHVQADERALDRIIDLARAMAERLLGEVIATDPGRIVAIARQALASARNARRVTISAHPHDAEALKAQLAAIGLEGATVQIHVDESRDRGSLYFDTDLGSLDAQLTLQLDRLTRSLREPRRA